MGVVLFLEYCYVGRLTLNAAMTFWVVLANGCPYDLWLPCMDSRRRQRFRVISLVYAVGAATRDPSHEYIFLVDHTGKQEHMRKQKTTRAHERTDTRRTTVRLHNERRQPIDERTSQEVLIAEEGGIKTKSESRQR